MKGINGIRQIKLLGLNNSLFCNEKHFESRNLDLIDAVLQDIELSNYEDEKGNSNEVSCEKNDAPEGKSGDASKTIDSNVIPPTSVVLLKERSKRAQHITSVPFDGTLDSNLIVIEAQLKGALVAGRSLTCKVCESSDVKQNKQLVELSMWRKTLMSELSINARSSQFVKI